MARLSSIRHHITPLTICVRLSDHALYEINKQLLPIVVSHVMIGMLSDTLAKEFSRALSYWMRESASYHGRDFLTNQVNEAFNTMVDAFVDITDLLDDFRYCDCLMAELVSVDRVSNSIAVRVSNG